MATDVAKQGAKFSIINARHVPVLTLSAQDNAKLLVQLKYGFKETINWNEYQQKYLTKSIIRFLN